MIVIAAGGHGQAGTAPGDSFVAFALPGANDSGPSLWSRTIDRPGGHFVVNLVLLGGGAAFVIWLIVRSVGIWRRRSSKA